MTLAVTGATGHLGALAVQALLDRGTPADQVVALVRDETKAASLAASGVVVRPFQYDAPDPSVLDGVDALLLVSGNELGRRAAQHAAVIDAATAAGVARLVYTSAPHADASINPVAPEHLATEQHLAASGVPHLVLRNGWYNENYLADLDAASRTGVLLSAAGDGRVASAARADYADAAAAALLGPETGTVTLTGDTAWGFADLAGYLHEALGRAVELRSVTPEEKATTLTAAGLDAGTVGFVVGVDRAIAAGELGEVTGDLRRLTGRPSTPVLTTLRAAVTG